MKKSYTSCTKKIKNENYVTIAQTYDKAIN